MTEALKTPPTVNQFRVQGYAFPGDGGEATFSRANRFGPGAWLAADQSYWLLVEREIRVEMFGASTSASATRNSERIQAALDYAEITGGTVRLSPGTVYTLNRIGEIQNGKDRQAYCLLIGSGVTLDLNGGTLRLDDEQNASLLLNRGANGAGASDIRIHNGVLDGNRSAQSMTNGGEMGCLHMQNVSRLWVRNLVVKDARQFAGRFLAVSDSSFVGLRCMGSDGDGWSFGLNGSRGEKRVFRSFIDEVHAEECLYERYGNQQGNPLILTVAQCVIGKVSGRNCGGGLKVQDSSVDSSIAQVLVEGGPNSTINSGYKIQGNIAAKLSPLRISTGQVIVKDAVGESVHVTDATDITIGAIVSSGGGSDASLQQDIRFRAVDGLQVGSISSTRSTGVAIFIDQDCTDYQLGAITVRDPQRGQDRPSTAIQIQTAGYGTIDALNAIDASGDNLDSLVRITNPNAGGILRSLSTTLPKPTPAGLLHVDPLNQAYEISTVRLGSPDPLSGEVTLSSGERTFAPCAHLFQVRVGPNRVVAPIIEVIARTPAAAAAGPFTTSLDSQGGPGIAILHRPPRRGAVVFWRVERWKVVSG